MKKLITLLLLTIITKTNQTQEHIDLIELNHKYDQKGNWIFDQIIYWEKHPHQTKYYVRTWHHAQKPEHYPQKHPTQQTWTNTWTDDKNHTHHHTTKNYQETWTQNDPERDNLKKLPQNQRLNLATKPPKNQL